MSRVTTTMHLCDGRVLDLTDLAIEEVIGSIDDHGDPELDLLLAPRRRGVRRERRVRLRAIRALARLRRRYDGRIDALLKGGT